MGKHSQGINPMVIVAVAGVVLGIVLVGLAAWFGLPYLLRDKPPASTPAPAVTTTTTTATTTTTTTTVTADTTTTEIATTEDTAEATTTTTEASTTETPTTTTTTAAPAAKLRITSPQRQDVTVQESKMTFSGTSDPNQPLYMNGVQVKRDASGRFSVTYNLSPGANWFTFTHGGEKISYVVRCKYTVLQSHSPFESQRCKGGDTIPVIVTARKGSTVTATFNGTTITLTQGAGASGLFVPFYGRFTVPAAGAEDVSLGKIQFTATHNGVTNTVSSGEIVCVKDATLSPPDTAAPTTQTTPVSAESTTEAPTEEEASTTEATTSTQAPPTEESGTDPIEPTE